MMAAEDVADSVEAVEQRDAAGNEEAAHEHGAGDSPEEDAGLVSALDLEEAEEQQEDEEVVDGERLFEAVAGEVLDGAGWARRLAEENGEGEGGGDPECCVRQWRCGVGRSGGRLHGAERRRARRRAGAAGARWKPIQ